MACEKYDDFEMGRLREAEFMRHLEDCGECRELVHLDSRLAEELEFLKDPVRAPRLWDRVEAGLRQEQKTGIWKPGRADGRRLFGPGRPWLVPALALLLFGVGLGIFFGVKIAAPRSELLAEGALRKIEVKEKEYIQAIADLEKKARPLMASRDLNLMSLYRTRLETIDAQIVRCKEALDTNPGNAHIRRYLLAALQDKRQTLAEVLGNTNY